MAELTAGMRDVDAGPRDLSSDTIKYDVDPDLINDEYSSALSKVIPGFYAADMGDDLHHRCDKLFKKLKLIKQVLT